MMDWGFFYDEVLLKNAVCQLARPDEEQQKGNLVGQLRLYTFFFQRPYAHMQSQEAYCRELLAWSPRTRYLPGQTRWRSQDG